MKINPKMPRSLGIPDDRVDVPWNVLVKQGGMAEQNLNDHIALTPIDGFRTIYGNEDGMLPAFGLQYKGKLLIRVSDIVGDSKYNAQIYRSGGNGQSENIQTSIRDEGWCLKELPLMVQYDPETEKFLMLDGRTRVSALEGLGVHPDFFVIVDVYVVIDDTKDVRGFPMFVNTIGHNKGKPAEADVVAYLSSRLKDGFIAIDSTLPDLRLRRDLKSKLQTEAERVGCGAVLSKVKLNRILDEALTGKFSFLPTRKFKDATDAEMCCQDDLGLVMETEDAIRVCVHSDQAALLKTLVSRIPTTDTRKIEVIVFVKELLFEDPVKHFKMANLQICKKMEEVITEAEQLLFPGIETVNRVKILGTIPQCYALEDKFPMDQLIRYDDLTATELNGEF
jgi:hypothetical protein